MKFFNKLRGKCPNNKCSIKKDNCIFLKDVSANTNVELEELCNGYRLQRKLQEMGLTKGVKFKVLNNTSKGPVVLSVRGSKLALGFGMSKQIMVREVAQ